MEIESAAEYVRLTRATLAASGFERREVEGTVYWSGGQAILPVLVLIHGVNDQAGTWFTIAPTLARTHRVILPDLPGHGESEPHEGALTLSMMVQRIEAIVAAECPEPFVLLGNSLGGWIAMLYALVHPARVAHLVLETSGGLSRPVDSPVIATNRDQALLILRNVHGPRFEPQEWMIEALLARATDSPMLRVTGAEQHFMDPHLANIQVPTTILWGADDGVLPVAYAEALQAGIEGARLHIIEGAAHIPHIQQPERFLACLPSIS